MNNLEQRINAAREAIKASEVILIGGGAGLSAAAGLDYGGKRFTDNFADFIKKYGITDMYSGLRQWWHIQIFCVDSGGLK